MASEFDQLVDELRAETEAKANERRAREMAKAHPPFAGPLRVPKRAEPPPRSAREICAELDEMRKSMPPAASLARAPAPSPRERVAALYGRVRDAAAAGSLTS